MTNKERDALINYLNYRFGSFFEKFDNSLDPVMSYDMYNFLVDILNDLEDNIVTNQLYDLGEEGKLEKYIKRLPKKDD